MRLQLREALGKSAVRVIDLFREWDEASRPEPNSLTPTPRACVAIPTLADEEMNSSSPLAGRTNRARSRRKTSGMR